MVMQDYELLMLILSVASYQKSNGPVKMYADEAALEYLESLSVDKCFKNGTELLTVPEGIDRLIGRCEIAHGLVEIPDKPVGS